MADLIFSGEKLKLQKEIFTIIKNGVSNFVKVGNALITLKKEKLYEDRYDSFEDCCREEFGIGKAYAYRLIESARVVKSVSTIVDKIPTAHVAHELGKVPVPHRRKVLSVATKDADEQERTVQAKDIQRASVKLAVPMRNKREAVDEVGRKIPAALVDLWNRRNEVQHHLTALTKLKSTINQAVDINDTLFIKIHHQTFLTRLDAVYHDLKFSMPYAVCGLCQGVKCKGCKTGLMSKLEWDQLVPAETKARFEKR